MKLRNSFVSNSSSCSYIIAVDKYIRTVDDVLDYVSNRSLLYAIRIFQYVEGQKGVAICKSPSPNCGDCQKKFICFTNTFGYGHCVVTEFIEWAFPNYNSDLYWAYEYFGDRIENFCTENEGKIAYFISIPERGDGYIDDRIRERGLQIITAPKAILQS